MAKPDPQGEVLRELVAKELSPSTWPDFLKLFEKHGGVWGGCWCMFYHVDKGWSKRSFKQNKEEKELLVRQGKSHGVLLYHKGEPVGWCQFGPREELPRIDKMRNYKPPKEENLWRITCFFIDKDHRGRGVAKEALRAAQRIMKDKGVRVVEAYPKDTSQKKYSSSLLWSGTLKLFEESGFRKINRLGKHNWIVQKDLQ